MSADRAAAQPAAPTTSRILVVGTDPMLVDECRTALAGLPDRRAVVYGAASEREAIETARNRQPHFVVIEAAADIDVALVSRDVYDIVPGVAVAAALEAEQIADGEAGGPTIISLLRAGVRDVLRRPISPIELGDVLDRLVVGRPQALRRPPGRVVSFVSNKGGAGKSTLSVNVACALAQRHPGQVLLIDASLQLGTCAFMLGVTPTATVLDAARERTRLDEALLRGLTAAHASGLRLLAAPADALEASDIDDESFSRVLHVARRTFEYVIVDTFPMLDSVVIAALDASDLVCVVLPGTAPSVAGIAKLLDVLEGLGFSPERRRIVLNRNHARFLGDLTPADIEGRIDRPVDDVVPYDRGVLVSMNTAEPHALRAPWWSGFRRAIERLADAVDAIDPARPKPGPDPGSADRRARFDDDRRTGRDRRIRDVGFGGDERRSGFDRRLVQMAPRTSRPAEEAGR